MLHQCLEVFINERVNKSANIDDSWNLARQHSKKVGVLSDFLRMSKSTSDSLSENASSVETEVPFILDKFGSVRIGKYHEVDENSILVGTADLVVFNKDGSVTIADWKTGLDDVDSPDTNQQLMSLSFMAQSYYGFKSFYMAIVNPITREFSISLAMKRSQLDLGAILEVDKTSQGAGNNCLYCPLKSNCGSFMQMSRKELLNAGFADIVLACGQPTGRDDQTPSQSSDVRKDS